MNQEDPTLALRKLLSAYAQVQVVACTVRLGILDRLAQHAHSIQELAQASGTRAAELERLMRVVCALGLVELAADGSVGLTSSGRLLTREGPLYGHAIMSGSDYYRAWLGLDEALRTGESAFAAQHGVALWQRVAEQPEVAASFAKMMRQNTRDVGKRLLGAYELPATGVVADLGAGDGTLLADVLEGLPGWHGVAVEQQASVVHVEATIRERGLSERCRALTGDLLDVVPGGADVYLLKSVLHNWRDDAAARILGACRAAMSPQSRLLVIERVIVQNAHPGALNDAMQDLSMLVLFGARDRSVAEYRALLSRAGFVIGRVFSLEPQLTVIEAKPALG